MSFRWVPLSLLMFFPIPPMAQPQAASPKSAPAPAAQPAVPGKSADYSAESYVVEKYSTDVVYAADGTGERSITVRVRVQSDAAVRQFGVLEFPYESRNEHLDFVYVRVRKADGSVVATPDTEAQDQPAEVTRQAPFYSDIRNKQLPVKSLSVGDELEYQVREVRTVAAAPGQFWYAQNFLASAVVLEETASLTVPKGKYVQVESAANAPEITESGDRKVYRWKTAQLEKTKVPDEKAKKPVIVEQPPSIAVTTFKSWEEVGRWYGDLQKDRVGVTPTIQAKANELTNGLSTDDEKIAAIYTYVATQYRYIGVAFGIGRYQPHTADDVMQNQYGDCKDKHTLLASLLRAAGYDAWPVLVGSQHVLQPKVPSPGQFDHVITAVTVNKTVLWMDSTPEVAPFRLLFSGLRDKLVLGIPTGAAAVLMKTPANPPFDAYDKYDGKATLATDGTLTARFAIDLRGDDELVYRITFHQVPRMQWQTLVQNISYGSGFAGTVSNIDAGSPARIAEPFHYSYDYTRKEYADWENRRILPLMPPVAFAYGEDDAKPAETILLGGPVTYTFHSSIELPSTYTAELPPAAKIATDFASYSSTYSLDKNTLIIDRTFVWKQRELPVSKWEEYLKFEKAVQSEAGGYIQLIGAGAGSGQNQAASNPDAAKLIQRAFGDIATKNYDSARLALDQAAKLSPTERGLWAGYGYADFSQNRVDEGFEAYKKEIANHPENFGVYYSLAGMQEYHQHPDEAEKTLRALLAVSPDDVKGHQLLAGLLVRRKRLAEAVPVLEEAVKLSPDNAGLKVMLGNAELGSGGKEKGAAQLRDVLATASEALTLNDAAYSLADAGLELPLARASCEKALHLLDEKTSAISLSSLSDEDLRRVLLLGATWDTMAWILYKQGEYQAALGYARAAWMLDQRRAIGTHLGQIYEKLQRKDDAVSVYELAMAAGRDATDEDVPEARRRLEELKAVKYVKEINASNGELADLRSVKIPMVGRKTASADFFVLFSAKGVEDVSFLKGEEALKASAATLKGAKFDVPFPQGSAARIARRGILYCAEALKGCQFTMLLPETAKRN